MATEDVDHGRHALAQLQALILRAREIGYNGGNMEVMYQEQVEPLGSALYLLDKYLTGKTENRHQDDDEKRFYEMYVHAKPFFVHLSDGGYSRLTLNVEDGHPVTMDRGLSRDPVKKKWAALFPPS